MIDSLELWYSGAGLHNIKNIEHIRTLEYLPSGGRDVTGKQLAEKLLDLAEFATRQEQTYRRQTGTANYAVTKATTDAIDRVHRHLEGEIRSKWDVPELSEQELADALATHALEQTDCADLLDGTKKTAEIVL